MARAEVAKLPKKLTLPSGIVLQLRYAGRQATEDLPIVHRIGEPLFEEVARALDSGAVVITKDGAPLDLDALVLRDFHVLRAVLTRSEILAEDDIEIACRNCGSRMNVRPCASLEIGPWEHGEANDAELDATLPFGDPIDVPLIALGRVRTVRTVIFEDRTVKQAAPLFAAAARERLEVDEALVRGMGVLALGTLRDRRKIAEALARCDDEAFFAVGNAFLASHYVARLGCVVFCESCGARNDVDAPYVRESGGGSGNGRESEREPAGALGALPAFDAFATRAKDIAQPLLAKIPGEPVEVVIEDGVPAVDDGGEPLLGSYVPPHPGDGGMPTRSPCVTVYYRTFRAMWEEDGPYDWDDELSETIEHELEHHIAFLRGEDAVDDDERAEIADEAERIVGRRETERRAIAGFGASWTDFLRRTWPIWVLAIVALAFMLATQR